MRAKDPTLRTRPEKRCPRCGITKPRAEYHKRTSSSDGLSPYCMACLKERRKELRARAPEGAPGAEERFWSRVEKTDTCWLWRGGITTQGYGRFFYRGKDVPSHHMPMIFRGETPPKYPMVCDHLCRVRNCVRPDHIEVTTQGVNTYRGVSPFAKNKAKTHCIRGHEFSPENTRLTFRDGKPLRQCKACEGMRPSDIKRRAA